jgi:hypothetical protein
VARRSTQDSSPWWFAWQLSARDQRRTTLAALLATDAFLLLDSSLKWHLGSGFLAQPAWWSSAPAALVLSFGCWYWITRTPRRFWLAWPVALLLGLLLAGISSSGCRSCTFDWLTADTFGPLVRFWSSGESTWLDVWTGGAVWGALAAALGAALLLRTQRKNMLHSGPCATGRLASALGLAGLCLLLGCAWEDNMYGQRGEVPAGALGTLWWVLAIAASGLFGLGVTIRRQRAAWLREVARGAVAGYGVRQAHESDCALPVFHEEPFAELDFVLQTQKGDTPHPLGRIPDVRDTHALPQDAA